MSNQDIINHGKAVDAFGAAQQDMLDKLAEAQQKTLDVANAVDARITNLESVTAGHNIYLAGITGNDDSNGRSLGQKVKTVERVQPLLIPGARNIVHVLEDMDFDYQLALGADIIVDVRCRNSDGTADEERLIAIKDAINSTSRPGGFAADVSGLVTYNNAHLRLDTARGFAHLEARSFLKSWFLNCSYSKTAQVVNCNLLWSYFSGLCVANFLNSPINNIAGNVCVGFGAGANPNSSSGQYNYKTNLTSV